MRSILFHVDVDAFFASAEQLRNPFLRGRPVAVGSGVIASCSYEARARGLSNGMALHQAQRICPELVVVEGRYEVYRCLTDALWEICLRYAPAIETFLDEALCDFSGTDRIYPDLVEVGHRLRREVREEIGLPVTVGIAKNRMMARLASKSAKPDGLRFIPPGQEEAVLLPLGIEHLPGVGPKTAALFREMKIRTVGEFRAIPRETLEGMLGKVGHDLYDRARGEDTRAVREREIPRTISRETTFHEATAKREEIDGMLFYLVDRGMRTIRQLGLQVRTVKVSLRYSDWVREDATRSLPPTSIDEEVQPVVRQLLWGRYTRRVTLRHVGVVFGNFSRQGAQLDLFSDGRFRLLHEAVDQIRERFGHGAIVAGRAISLLGKIPHDSYGYILRTPSLTK